MSIAYIVPSLVKRGPVIVACELAVQMVARGHEVRVFYFDEKIGNRLDFPCPVQRIGFWHRIDFERFDVVHTNGLRPDAYVWLHKPLRHSGTRFVSTLHNFVTQDFSAEYNRLVAAVFGNLWMWLLRRHDVRVVLSHVAELYYQRWFHPGQLTCIYNSRCVDLKQMLTQPEMEEVKRFKGEMHLLGVNAMLSPVKGVDLILKALPSLENVRLMVIGEGKSRPSLQLLAKELGVSDRVLFAGYREDAFRYLPLYDLYLMPSRSEGFPLALLEAVAMRRNVVCSDIPIFKEIFTDEEVTFFEMENVRSLAEAIRYALWHNKSEAAYRRYLEDYSPERFADNHEKVYRASDSDRRQ